MPRANRPRASSQGLRGAGQSGQPLSTRPACSGPVLCRWNVLERAQIPPAGPPIPDHDLGRDQSTEAPASQRELTTTSKQAARSGTARLRSRANISKARVSKASTGNGWRWLRRTPCDWWGDRAQVVVVHGGKVVMDQRHGVDHLQGHGGGQAGHVSASQFSQSWPGQRIGRRRFCRRPAGVAHRLPRR